jgi:hypothetical protein
MELMKEVALDVEHEILLGEVEFRVSSFYVRTDDAHAIYPVDPRDLHDEWSRKIVRAVYLLVEAKKLINPVNIKEYGAIPDEQIEKRINDFRSIWALDMPTYVERIQAEGLRTRAMRERKESYDELGMIPWRQVEQTHAIGAQKISSVQIGGVGGMEDDVGYMFEHATDVPEEENAPMPLAWPWISASLKGGIRPGNTHVFAGPPGNRKTGALMSEIHDAVLIRGKKWVHFAFDGGLVRDQMMNLFVIHWTSLLIQRNVPLKCRAMVYADGSTIPKEINDYVYINTVVAWKLLYNKETNITFPPGALDFFSQARQDMAALQAGKGPGLLVMVGPKKVGGDIYKLAQRLRNEQYGRDRPIDAWSLDHIGMPTNQYSDPGKQIPENTRVVHHFVTNEGPPSLILSQLSQEGVKNIGKGEDVDPHLRYNNELYADAHGIWLFKYDSALPEVLNMITMKNRDAAGGPKVKHILRVQPQTGYVRDDPAWAKGAATNIVKASRRRVKSHDNDEEEDDD